MTAEISCIVRRNAGFTIIEVLVAALLIAASVGSIMSINLRSIYTLKASHQAAAGSQVLQQRIESIRMKSWAEIASSASMASVMGASTESESELADGGVTETIRMCVPLDSAHGPVESARAFQVRRYMGSTTVEAADDFTSEPTLFVQDTVTWRDRSGVHQRVLRTIVCATGLTRSGIFGSQLGRPGN